jgi:Lrp/AsnC family transcriptional regulator, regulator for asnA, asnC and gidA
VGRPLSAFPLSHEPTIKRLDDTDRRIIEHLQRDGRASFTTIATDLGIDEGEVESRVEVLRSAGVISIVAVTDPLQLGYPRNAMLGIEVDGAVKPVAESLERIEEVVYLALTDGGFDLLAEVVGTSDAHLLELVTRIRPLPGVKRIHTFLYQELVKESYAYGTASI